MAITFKETKTPISSEEVTVTAADVERIKEQVRRANYNLEKKMKKIVRKEAEAWKKSQKRRFSF